MTAKAETDEVVAGSGMVLFVPVSDESGNRVSLSGSTVTFRMAYAADLKTVLVSKSDDDGIEVVADGDDEEYKITIGKTDTLSLAGRVSWQLEMTESGGLPWTVLRGTTVFIPRIG